MRPRHVLGLALAALLVAAGAGLVGVTAAAAPVPQTGSDGLLALHADPYPAQNLAIAPGERLLWPVTAEIDAPTTGDLSVSVTSWDPLAEDAAALRFELASCEEEWQLPGNDTDPAVCPRGESVEITEEAFAAIDDTEVWALGDIAPGIPRYFLVTLSLPLSTPGALADQPGSVSFGFFAADQARGSRLAETGASYAGPVLLAAGMLLGGLVLARGRRGRGAG